MEKRGGGKSRLERIGVPEVSTGEGEDFGTVEVRDGFGCAGCS